MAFKVGDPQRRRKQGGIPIADEGLKMTFAFTGGALIICMMGYCGAALGFILVAVFAAFFFRDPERKIPTDPQAIVAPADGRVVKIKETPGNEYETGRIELSIFLSIFDVHINRSPIDGRVSKIDYRRGSFKNAMNNQASEANEQTEILIYHEGQPFVVKQIAGLIARRIVCWLVGTELVRKGERIGLIQFGSRVDLIMPKTLVDLQVKEGDKVKGGESIVAYLKRGSEK